MKLEATPLRDNVYAVRPEKQLGTCGFYPKAWTVRYVKARSSVEAIRKATPWFEDDIEEKGDT